MNTPIKESWLHKVNPALKLLILAILFVFAVTIHQLNVMIPFTLTVSILFFLCTGQPYRNLFLILIPFFLVFFSTSLSMILFGKGDTTLFKWGIIHVTEESLYRGVHLGFRALVFALMGITFVLTTKPVKLFYSLMQQLKLQPKYAYSFMAAIRLIPIMFEEFKTIRDAQKVRGLHSEKGVWSKLKRIKALPIPLLSQSIRRAFRIAVAMEAKRFNSLQERTFYYQVGFSTYDLLFISYIVSSIGLSYWLASEFPLFPVTDVRY
ncbi:energy-coupling factor transporter transmembrane component T family protein [Fictibacillus phosphorivorans]|uniref:energy-coupling factor transporter transmembrane component T family protein n=1 Tax=Fictibacillus phosphorivorans TaxID=1221500 RepID=UPI00203CA04C|nr:energy-coupling factor transporter transmembrane component T [Fictibacillus phosphorivorans]MCM3719345.1 energy-coupling factor transporter transmembrane protein EcfT [Fictibacillus phosphorivorans]MCM3776966.1 energy-coupling factor transporter transmembrane protein EcfT [Fictibacillus phosphorivorans]